MAGSSSSGGFASGAASGATAGSVFGPWGTAIGAVIGGVAGAYGTKKKAAPTAPFVPTPLLNAQQIQQQAISGSQANESSLEQLLAQSNRFQQGQASSLMEQAVPGYAKLSASITSAGQQQIDHPYDLPKDVQDNLNRIAAERGIKVGSAGQTQKFSALRDLGVNMLQYGKDNFQGALQALQTVTGLAPRVSPMSPMSFMLNSSQQLGIAQANQQTIQANNLGIQQTAQGTYNAQTAASNFNNQNTWNNLLGALGAVNGMYSATGTVPKK